MGLMSRGRMKISKALNRVPSSRKVNEPWFSQCPSTPTMQGSTDGSKRQSRNVTGTLSTPDWIEHDLAMMSALFPAIFTLAIELAHFLISNADYSKEKKNAWKVKVEVVHDAGFKPG